MNCPNCGAATAVRTFGHAVNVVCQNCQSILDAKDEGVTLLQKYKKAIRFDPIIPLGTRGTIAGGEFEVVGFQVREITVDGTDYRWSEYLLFNPYRGFRYISEYAGHWNVISTLRSLPEGDPMPGTYGSKVFDGEEYRHFQTAEATTIFVLGEFPWQIRVGDKATVTDYVAPPWLLSAEVTGEKEVTWSRGQYTSGAELWAGLKLQGDPPVPAGVFANQPSPLAGAPGRMWRTASLLIAVATLVWLVHIVTARRQLAFNEVYNFDPRIVQDASLVTPVFELTGRPSAVRVETTASTLANQWMFVGYALINDDTGQAYEFGREVSFYSGVEDGEAWTEGSRQDAVTLPRIPAGRYFLRIEPESERAGRPIRYNVAVIRDVPTSMWYLTALAFLAVPPMLVSFRASAFEQRRWQESDHGASSSSNGGDDDDSDDSGDDSDE